MTIGVALSIGALIGYIIGRVGSVQTPVGEVTVDQPSSTPVIVRVSGMKGIGYHGTIGTSKTGQKTIDGTLGTTSDDYKLTLDTSPGSTDIARAEVGKRAPDSSQRSTVV